MVNFSIYRQLLGLTQQEFAELLNISKQSYWNKENQKVPFSDKEKIIIRDMLRKELPMITIDEIFFS